jgi:hypothetical protein
MVTNWQKCQYGYISNRICLKGKSYWTYIDEVNQEVFKNNSQFLELIFNEFKQYIFKEILFIASLPVNPTPTYYKS